MTVRPSDVLSKYHGESERYLRGVFERARAVPRAVIFFDGTAPYRIQFAAGLFVLTIIGFYYRYLR